MSTTTSHQISLTSFDYSELDQQTQSLVDAAKSAALRAYAPYSNFWVGAALLLEDGSILTGNNQENAAYPSGMCAERTALFHYGSLKNGKKIVKLAVTARKSSDPNHVAVTPCGACRQVMAEYEVAQNTPFKILMQGKNNTWNELESVSFLLPFVFSPESLK